MRFEQGDFYILGGVHRAVAARECHLPALLAWLREDGRPSRLVLVEPSRLHSPKAWIDWYDKYRSFGALLALMGSAAGRAKLPPIEIERLGAKGQTASIPLSEVVITGQEGLRDG